MLPLIIQLVAGALGGNAAGAALKDKSLGTLGNTIAGAVGGGVLGQIVVMMGAVPAATDAAGGMDITAIISALVAGVVGGGALTGIAGYAKGMMAK